MKRLISLLILLTFVSVSNAQVNPPYPFVDDGLKVFLRNPGSRLFEVNTNFKVNATGGITESDSSGLQLRPYSTLSGATTELRFYELLANGENYVGFKAKDSLASSLIWTLPNSDSTGTQCLVSDGAFSLSWQNCGGGGGGTPGGASTQIQFNFGGSFAGDAGFTYDSSTDTATLGALHLTTALAPIYGGSGLSTITLNGVLYGNGTSPFSVTAQGAANSVLAANAGAPAFSQQPTLNTGIITKGQVAVKIDPFNTASGNTGELRFLELAANGLDYIAFKAPNAIAAPITFTLPATDSTGVQCLSSNGSATLSWVACTQSFANLAPGTNTTSTFNIDTGATLTYLNSGIINASQLGSLPANSYGKLAGGGQQIFTGTHVVPRSTLQTISANAFEIDIDTTDVAIVPALSAGVTVSLPHATGSNPRDYQKIKIVFLPSTSPQSITWNSIFSNRAGQDLPTSVRGDNNIIDEVLFEWIPTISKYVMISTTLGTEPGITTLSSSNTYTCPHLTSRSCEMVNTESAGALTIAIPSGGTPSNGKQLILKVKCTNAQSITLTTGAGGFIASPNILLTGYTCPASGPSWTAFGVEYSSVLDRFQLYAVN